MKCDVCTATKKHRKLILVIATKPGVPDTKMQTADTLSDSRNRIVGILRRQKIEWNLL